MAHSGDSSTSFQHSGRVQYIDLREAAIHLLVRNHTGSSSMLVVMTVPKLRSDCEAAMSAQAASPFRTLSHARTWKYADQLSGSTCCHMHSSHARHPGRMASQPGSRASNGGTNGNLGVDHRGVAHTHTHTVPFLESRQVAAHGSFPAGISELRYSKLRRVNAPGQTGKTLMCVAVGQSGPHAAR